MIGQRGRSHGALRSLVRAGLLALALATAPPGAAEPAPPWAYDIARELMSPFCPGLTLADCPSPAAEQVRMWIVDRAAEGQSREEVEAALFARYGDQVRARPRPEGFGSVAYLAPLAIFLVGGALLFWFLRRWGGGGRSPPPPSAPLDPEAERALDEALSK